MESTFQKIDKMFIASLRTWGIPLLRISLGIVFVWFGLLKVIGASPVAELIEKTYQFFSPDSFIVLLGAVEIIIGLGLIFNICLRIVLFVLWFQMFGTLYSAVLSPSLFFLHHNPFFLTIYGEFLVKNLVLIASSLVIGGYEVKPLK